MDAMDQWLLVMLMLCFGVGSFLLLRTIFRRDVSGQYPVARVIELLKDAGTNVLKAHDVDFFLYFPSQKSAEDAQIDINSIGLSTEITSTGRGDEWICVGMKQMLPIQSQIIAVSDQLSEIAMKHHGSYDGWGAGVVE